MIQLVTKRLDLMFVAGEPSGDAHAAALVKALHTTAPEIDFHCFGSTGPLMRAAGVESIVNSDDLAIMGIVEVGRVLPRFLRAFRKLKNAAISRSPNAVILVDWPEFNLRLAAALRRRGLKVVYYISPQLWAWRPRRVKNIKRDVDLLLSILPFEAEWYESRGVEHVEFVGHPLAGEVHTHKTRDQFCRRHNLDPARPIVSFLPGSRHKELERILPPMLDAITRLQRIRPELQFLVAVAPSCTVAETTEIISANHIDVDSLKLIQGETREALAASDAAAIASGTATLEAALLETPMVIVYKESPINWHTLGRLITVEHFGLVNLVAGRRVVTELMQDDLDGERLTAEMLRLLNTDENKAIRERLREVAHKLGEPGASQRAAQSVWKALREWGNSEATDGTDYSE
ncbi:MAG: lipid-A-disaccharide synthase [Blastocatellia bacterium]|nr:MAG: lipid-A-disaccharide synthase [Blastocatellia bacterium]